MTVALSSPAAKRIVAAGMRHGAPPPPPPSEERLRHSIAALDATIARKLEELKVIDMAIKDRQRVLAQLFQSDPDQKPLTEIIDTIFEDARRIFTVSTTEIRSPRRSGKVVLAKQYVAQRLKDETALSLPAIGAILGRDHTTIIHSCRPGPREKVARFLAGREAASVEGGW